MAPSDAYPQSFNPTDVEHWIQAHPAFGEQSILLDGRSRSILDPNDPETWVPTMEELVSSGVRTLAPPIWMLATTSEERFEPTAYGRAAREAGLNLVTWTVERSGQPSVKEDWYYYGLGTATTFYANCSN